MFTDLLSESSVKSQQACLNIINMVFSTSWYRNTQTIYTSVNNHNFGDDHVRVDLSSTLDSSGLALRSIRSYFLKSTSFHSFVVRLAEQSPSSVVRAKAILAMKNLCSLNANLIAAFASMRMPSLIVRIMEQIVTSHSNFLDNTFTSPSTISYLSKVALSFVSFLRFTTGKNYLFISTI
jgi:hypothetical protein